MVWGILMQLLSELFTFTSIIVLVIFVISIYYLIQFFYNNDSLSVYENIESTSETPIDDISIPSDNLINNDNSIEEIKKTGMDFKSFVKRRHSSTSGRSFLIAKAAHNYICDKKNTFRRQMTEISRESLPKPPKEFFEPSSAQEIPNHLKPENFYLIHSLRMLELPTNFASDVLQSSKFTAKKGDIIVKPGDEDDHLYVVLQGCLNVYIKINECKECLVKKIDKGHMFFSFLSLVDVLMGKESKFKTVSVRAAEDCIVAKYNLNRFKESFNENPKDWIRPIQIIVTRLLHVTMTTLHHYLGLTEELMKSRSIDENLTEKEKKFHRFGNSIRVTKSNTRNKMRRLFSYDEAHDQLDIAIKYFGETLGIPVEKANLLLQDRVDMLVASENQTVIEQGSNDNVKLILVVSGALRLLQEVKEEETILDDDIDSMFDSDQITEKGYHLILQKEIVGGLQLLSNEPSFYKVKAVSNCVLATIGKNEFNELLNECPEIALHVAYSIVRRLSPFIRAVDFALEWNLLDSGQALFRHGDKADSLYVVLTGRLRSVDKKSVLEEFGKGSAIGMVELVQKRPRQSTVLAIRYSQISEVSNNLLNYIKLQFPQVGFRLIKLLGNYFDSSNSQNTLLNGPPLSIDGISQDAISHINNLHTVAILPASKDVPHTAFTCELYHALNFSKHVLRLSSSKIKEQLGNSVLEKQADFRLMHWLNAQEDIYPLIIYECDYETTMWTRRCLRQADAILVVANGANKPLEKSFVDEHMMMNQDGIRTCKELVLLWGEDVSSPKGTYNWLKGSYFSGHHHVRMNKRMLQWDLNDSDTEKEILDYYEKNVYFEKLNVHSDFSRLARILTGNAIGLVLGGGGARGSSHIGVLKAMKEFEVPIDIIGGTSIGSFIGALYAQDPSSETIIERSSRWFHVMSSIWNKIFDLTYAYSAMFSGAGFNKSIRDVFKESYIEDCWIPYFCISTDITASEMRVHRSGSIYSYVRSSMSLAGYLPPLCDPIDGHLLLDGGYVNNLPADVMRCLGAKFVIAVDVGSREERNLYNYGDTLNGFWVLFKKLNPFCEPPVVLNMEEIQSRLAYVSCTRQLEMVKKAPYCCYLRPPIEEIKTLDFHRFDEVKNLGYEYGKKKIEHLVNNNETIQAILDPVKGRLRKGKVSGNELNYSHLTRASSFTDLAARISKIPSMRTNNSISDFTSLDICEESSDEDKESTPEVRTEQNSRAVTPKPSIE
ncbi:Neuropathy target esterase sws [Strongyloides ratti]|uniref:Neuropathy target esterase sws n=1 Tax=Strongyloides ratti TaxID=34506 RepID=A0A090LJW5_STRRB|nr:Neuropathy target esterase sws [Strongyloides ratti]CEF67820.1 Neuropathy target esterase sws [Strongyloides ratti]